MTWGRRRSWNGSVACWAVLALASAAGAQSTNAADGGQPDPPHGKILYQSHGEPQPPPVEPEDTKRAPAETAAAGKAQITDADRSAVSITGYDLDIRLTPARAGLAGRARIDVRNKSDKPLARIALQVSSSLRWESAAMATPGHPGAKLPLVQHLLDTDADHTGRANEAILMLQSPLEPGASVGLDIFYTGTMAASGGRLERMGASPEQALATDWDAVGVGGTALRGFGNVLWFPVAAPQLFLSDNTLVPAIGKERLAHAEIPVHLRLSVEYTGEAPIAAYFCARREALKALGDDRDAPVAFGSGIARAEWHAEAIGIRPMSLFVMNAPERMLAPLPGARGSSASDQQAAPMLAVETANDTELPGVAASAERVAPLLQSWLGARPLSALSVLDHKGQAFEDGPLVVAPVAALADAKGAPALADSLTHAWVQTGQPWMDEGLGAFFSLLWVEREKGRDAAVAALNGLMQPVAAADLPGVEAAPGPEPGADESSSTGALVEAGQPLVAAYDELFVRRKAAAVWWMLRDIAGEQPLQQALSAWRMQPVRRDSPEEQARAFETLLEKTSGKDLGWFFQDWVLHDRGLPVLSILDVTPRLLPAGAGHSSGWLVAVTMHNAGGAAAEVPLVIRSGTFSTTKRVRIPGGQSVTERVVVETVPTEVLLNDGSTPEAGPSTHTRTVELRQER